MRDGNMQVACVRKLGNIRLNEGWPECGMETTSFCILSDGQRKSE